MSEARAIYLVGCGASKLDRPARARELYTGSLFVAARRYVELQAATWLILSAKHGVVDPRQRLEPYEQKLPKRGEDLLYWAKGCASGALYKTSRWVDRERGIPDNTPDPRRFIFLCGVEYARPVAEWLTRFGYPSEQPLEGLQLGERLRWFKKRMEAA